MAPPEEATTRGGGLLVWPYARESRSLRGCTATGAERRMQPDKASAVMAAMIEYRNARATRTGAIPHNETAPVLHRLWLTIRVAPQDASQHCRHPELLALLASLEGW